MQKKVRRGQGSGLLKACLVGLVVSFLVMAVVCCVGAAFISSETVAYDAIEEIVIIAALLGTLAGTFTATRMFGERKLLTSAIIALSVVLLRLVCGLFGEETTAMDGMTLKLLLSCAVGSTAGAAMNIRKKRHSKGRRK